MGRLMTIAVLVAVVAGVVTIAAGGVDPREQKKTPKATIAAAEHSQRVAVTRARVGARVPMRALSFTRPRVTIRAGETARFVNRDNVAHTVYATLGGETGVADFASKRIPPGDSYTTPVLVHPGTYSYVCTLHPTVMTGVIKVIS